MFRWPWATLSSRKPAHDLSRISYSYPRPSGSVRAYPNAIPFSCLSSYLDPKPLPCVIHFAADLGDYDSSASHLAFLNGESCERIIVTIQAFSTYTRCPRIYFTQPARIPITRSRHYMSQGRSLVQHSTGESPNKKEKSTSKSTKKRERTDASPKSSSQVSRKPNFNAISSFPPMSCAKSRNKSSSQKKK
ncbi:hypothetical protein VUR80DRAFT_5833 [Thermomyces stellatus]